MKKINDISFFDKPAEKLAECLIGKWVARKFAGEILLGQINEVEAYCGVGDSACHSYLGRKTKRNRVLWEESGTIYVYLCYGIHEMFNIVCGGKNPEAVLIRGVANYQGPGRVGRYFRIDRKLNGNSLIDNNEIYILDDGNHYDFRKTPRIGIDYALEEDRKALLRFVLI